MSEESLKRVFGCARTLADGFSVEVFGGRQQRPSPAVFAVVLVVRIDEIFGNDVASHLQTGDVAVELAAHLCACEATEVAKFSCDEAAIVAQGGEDGIFNCAFFGSGAFAAAVVVEVCPPFFSNKARFLIEKLAIDAVAFGHDSAFPFP